MKRMLCMYLNFRKTFEKVTHDILAAELIKSELDDAIITCLDT